MEFQVKVEYVKDKWIAFMVSSCLVSAAGYGFKYLIEDTKLTLPLEMSKF